VERTVAESGLIRSGSTLVVAVSGGADSVALLAALRAIARLKRLRLVVAHMEHGIRGAASRADAEFVAALARRWRIPARIGRCRAPLRAKRRRMSLEAAAREARYDFLSRVARETGADAVATAHTADDQAETVLMNICRGTGVAGLGGVPPAGTWRGVRIVRPLLFVGHAELVEYLTRGGIGWREDETNADDRFMRNRIRRQVIPMLAETLNPSIRAALCRLAEICRNEAEPIEAATAARFGQAALPDGGLSAQALRQDGPAMRANVLRRWLVSRGVPSRSVDHDCIVRCEAVLSGGSGSGTVPLCGGWEVVREYGVIRVRRGGAKRLVRFRARVACPGVTVVDPPGVVVRVSAQAGIVRPARARAGDMPAEASLSAKRVGGHPLFLRSWRAGDRIRPYGMAGSRKVQDILTDQKVPREVRAGVPVLECDGEIVWIPGYRIARGWELADESASAVRIRVTRARRPRGLPRR
jgi:tRNA(Ile)-lysidine synthase